MENELSNYAIDDEAWNAMSSSRQLGHHDWSNYTMSPETWNAMTLHEQLHLFFAVGKDGTLLGHIVAATFTGGYGIFWYTVIYKRMRQLGPDESYCEKHVPERNMNLLYYNAWAFIILMGFATFIYESLINCMTHKWNHGCYFSHYAHEALYFIYGLTAVVQLLERKGRLPPDSWRLWLALSGIGGYLIWNNHAMMKEPPGKELHTLIGYVSLAKGVFLVASYKWNQNIVLHMAAIPVPFTLMGVLLLWTGFHAIRWVHFNPMKIYPVFTTIMSVIVIATIVVGALMHPSQPLYIRSDVDYNDDTIKASELKPFTATENRNGQYGRLKMMDDDDDNEAENDV